MIQLPAPDFAADHSDSLWMLFLLPVLQVSYTLEFPLDGYLYDKGHNWGNFLVQMGPSTKMGSEVLNW